jgi:hypothetical protein
MEKPIELVGLEIPDLQYFLVFEKLENPDVQVELRPVNSEGTAVLNHPCLDIWIGAIMTVQMTADGFAREPAETGSVRGEELFRGVIGWEWDAAPEAVFRYSATIPGAGITEHPAPYRVIDYLIIVPRPEAQDEIDIDAVVESAWRSRDPDELRSVLDAYVDAFTYYLHTSWNVGSRE